MCDTPHVINAPSKTTEQRPGRSDQCALPQENRGNVDAPVPHRTQNRDLLYFREHRHRKDIKNTEAGQQDDKRNGNRDGHSQGQKKLQRALLAFLPARGAMLKERFETTGQSRRAIRDFAVCI